MILRKTHIIIIAAVAIPGSLLYFLIDPAASSFFPPCPLFTITGFFCPGCGSQRAYHDLLHGNILNAADHNLMFVLALPLITFSGVVAVNNLLSNKKMMMRIFDKATFAWAVLIFVLLFWIMRNVPLYPFSVLAP